jgi:hypothetical protein
MITKEEIEAWRTMLMAQYSTVSVPEIANARLDLNAILDLARQRIEMQPRPIEEAPKDGIDILVFDDYCRPLVMRWSADQKMWAHIGGLRVQGAFWTFIPLSSLTKASP